MLLEGHHHSTQLIHYKGVEFVLSHIKAHYSSCADLLSYNSNQNISRSANRFIKIEKSMIDEITKTFSHQNDSNLIIQTPIRKLNNYHDMYKNNVELILFLKVSMKKLNNKSLSAFLSYWVAALQIENDEISKYL